MRLKKLVCSLLFVMNCMVNVQWTIQPWFTNTTELLFSYYYIRGYSLNKWPRYSEWTIMLTRCCLWHLYSTNEVQHRLHLVSRIHPRYSRHFVIDTRSITERLPHPFVSPQTHRECYRIKYITCARIRRWLENTLFKAR